MRDIAEYSESDIRHVPESFSVVAGRKILTFYCRILLLPSTIDHFIVCSLFIYILVTVKVDSSLRTNEEDEEEEM